MSRNIISYQINIFKRYKIYFVNHYFMESGVILQFNYLIRSYRYLKFACSSISFGKNDLINLNPLFHKVPPVGPGQKLKIQNIWCQFR